MTLVLLAIPSSALANEKFPAELAEDQQMPCVPACTICHTDNQGGYGTARKPLAIAWQGWGLDPGDPSSVGMAVALAEIEDSDVDGDGETDLVELSAGFDPNTPGSDSICLTEPPGYGCGATVAPRPRTGGFEMWPLVAAVVVGVAGAVARRRRTRQ